MSDDILFETAKVWSDLMEYKYILTYGYKNQLTKINLIFSKEDFSHLAGFQYLKGLPFLKYNSSQLLDKILKKKITYAQISKGRKFKQMVEPRLHALIHLQDILDNDFRFYTYTPKLYPFSTTIKADYLISSNQNSQDYVFIIRISTNPKAPSDFLCCSAFSKGTRDYEYNQSKRTLLKKERIHLPTNTSVILFDKLNSN